MTESSTEQPSGPKPCDCSIGAQARFLPCIPHKADLKAATAVMRSSEGRGPQSFGLACGLVQGAVVYSQKKFVFIFEFFKLRVQSASLVIVLWFCSKSCFLMHFKSSHRSFSHRGMEMRCRIRFGRRLGKLLGVAFPAHCLPHLQLLPIVLRWLESGEDTIACCPLGVNKFDLMVLGGSD